MTMNLKASASKESSAQKRGKPLRPRPLARLRGWAPILILPCVVLIAFPSSRPRWAFMWTLAFAIYVGCKWLTWRRTSAPAAPFWKHAAYLLAWPGMDAAAFLDSSRKTKSSPCDRAEWISALTKLIIGILLFWGLARMVPSAYSGLTGWIGMVGMIMSLHFGLFHLLSCGWRALGVDARPLMNAPLKSASISEFWGVRWNTAFRDLTHRFLFRPLMPRLGARGAVIAGFLVSGLIHDLVISIPAGGGYGGPTLFFLVQGGAILLSRSVASKRMPLRKGGVGRSFTLLILLLPVGLLFHSPFVFEIILPFMKFIGAI